MSKALLGYGRRFQWRPPSVASKLSTSSWNGTWHLARRVGFEAVLKFNGVPEDKLEQASAAQDIWSYRFCEDGSSFHMEHTIPATGFYLNYVASIDGIWTDVCPYQKTGLTSSRFKDGGKVVSIPKGWCNTWDPLAGQTDDKTRFRTELRNPDGTLLRFWRHLTSPSEVYSEINIVRELSGGGEVTVVGPAFTYFTKVSDELPRALTGTAYAKKSHGGL
mmetsp:Transcript_49305/g.105319  ORF Transcript_49305/g.105319 Transcript_49305/m.105319 type:complete len:219 (-) Transcript_49305:518-1174(-)